MANEVFTNNAYSTLAAALAAAGTGAVLATGDGALFASPSGGAIQRIELKDNVDPDIYEIVYLTTRVTDSLTITRAQEGTTARDWDIGTIVAGGVTAQQAKILGQFDNDGNARGSNAINLQSGRTNVANVASGARATATGYDTKASGADSLAEGSGSAATNTQAVALGFNAIASGLQAVALQSGRNASDRAASGTNAIVIGYSPKASGPGAIAAGDSATATGNNAIAMSYNSAATGDYSISFGINSVASALHAVTIGADATATAEKAVSLGNSADATGIGSTAVGDGAQATSQYAVAVGNASQASALSAVAVGVGAESKKASDVAVGAAKTRINADWTTHAVSTAYSVGNERVTATGDWVYQCLVAGTSGGSAPTWGGVYVTDGTVVWRRKGHIGQGRIAVGSGVHAIGQSAFSSGNNGAFAGGDQSICFSGEAAGNTSLALSGGNAYHDKSVVVGTQQTSRGNHVLLTGSCLPSLDQYPNWNFGYEPYWYAGLVGSFISETIDFAGGSTWAASTAYKHGKVVKPTTPNGKQYVCVDANYNGLKIDAGVSYTGSTSGGSEPTWPTVNGDSVTDNGNIDWVCIDNAGYTITPPMNFVVRSVGIIVYEYTAITVQPYVSIGTTGNLTLFVNNQQTTNLTAANKAQFWNITDSQAVPDVTIKIDTLATGTQLLCRVVFEGYYTKHWL